MESHAIPPWSFLSAGKSRCERNILCHYFPISIFSPFKSTSGMIAAGAAVEYSAGDGGGEESDNILCVFFFSFISLEKYKTTEDCFGCDCVPLISLVL